MADQPIEPTRVELSGERGGTPPPPPPPPPSEPPTVGMSDAFLPPPRRGDAPPPPPSGPPPGSGGGGLPEPGEWWRKPDGGRGGGVATAPAPVYAPPAEVHHHHYYPATPAPAAAPPRFQIGRIRPVANGVCLIAGAVIARTVWNPLLHTADDPSGMPMLGLIVSAVLEWRWRRYRVWPVRVFTCSWCWTLAITPAGQELVSYVMTRATW